MAIGDLDLESAERTLPARRDAIGAGLDVTDHAGFTAFLDEVERTLGPLDVLVNNAGIMPVTPLAEECPDSISRQLDLNLHAVIHGTQEAIRRMVPRGTGHIVNIASIAGRSGFPHLATYCATKHGVVGLSEAVRQELRGTGVEISVVMPSLVRTELATGLADSRVKADRAGGGRRELVRRCSAPLRGVRAALQRPARPVHEPIAAPRARGVGRGEGRSAAAEGRPLGARRLRGARGGQRPGRRERAQGGVARRIAAAGRAAHRSSPPVGPSPTGCPCRALALTGPCASDRTPLARA